MKHTKGNWLFIPKTNQIEVLNKHGELETVVCKVTTNNKEEAEANAKLICAAPEMLEVLTSTFRRLWELRDSDTICEQDREIIIDIETTMLNVMVKGGYDAKNANTGESNMHPIFKEALAPFGIK